MIDAVTPGTSTSTKDLRVIAGRYVLGEVIGRGGAATVHFGKGVERDRRGVVAIKKLHPHLASDPAFVAMMLDEARLLSRVRHTNVVSTFDVVMEGGELYLVMEYVHGVTLGSLLAAAHRRKTVAPIGVASAVLQGALAGLHAAHEATGSSGEPLGMVHRDVSPQNLLIAESGAIKVVDFGIAKAEGRVHHTQDGSIKGKLGYMPPEQLFGEALDRRADVYAAGVMLWEMLAGERLFAGDDGGPALVKSLVSMVAPPSERRSEVSEALDRVVLRALSHDRHLRFDTALSMADALNDASPAAPPAEVSAWARKLAGEVLDQRGAKLFAFEQTSRELVRALPRRRDSLVSFPGGADPPRRRWILAAAAALCAAAGGSAAAVLTAEGRSGSAAAAETSTASLAPAGLPPAPASGTTTVVILPAADAPSAPTASAGPDPAPPATAPADPARTTAPQRAVKAAPTSKPATKPDGCDPPFTIDAQGHKRYKRECLR